MYFRIVFLHTREFHLIVIFQSQQSETIIRLCSQWELHTWEHRHRKTHLNDGTILRIHHFSIRSLNYIITLISNNTCFHWNIQGYFDTHTYSIRIMAFHSQCLFQLTYSKVVEICLLYWQQETMRKTRIIVHITIEEI